MTPFRDDHSPDAGEPVPGLPEPLPPGESLVWQGRPAPLALAVHAFHIRFIAAYLVIVVAWRMAAKASAGAPASDIMAVATSGALLGGLGLALVLGLAWVIARSALFTLTEKRIVMRYGVAIRKYVNLPFSQITSADLRMHGNGRGDVALTTEGKSVGYIYLWPFARPMKFAPPHPSLRALPDAATVAQTIADAFASERAGMPAAAPRIAPEANSPPTPAALPSGAQPA
ncbi:MAG: photosynthetic complex putative assembly protein PuhB [Pseudomonadota bacterium]